MKKFLTPGPINLSKQTSYLLKQTPPYFAHEEFGALLETLKDPLGDVFKTINPVLIGTGSGTLAMETVLNNFFEPANNVIIISAGKYGKHWETMCKQYHDINVDVLHVSSPLDWPETMEKLKKMLQSSEHFNGVFMTHCETTTAIRAPISEINTLVKENQPACLTVVDAVSTIGVEDIESQKYDIVISSSQKGLQCPPGLFFITFNMYAYNTADRTCRRSFYFDVITEFERYHNNQTSHTPAANLFAPLKYALQEIEGLGGVDEVIANCAFMAKITREILEEHGIVVSGSCNVCTAFETPHQKEIQAILEKKGWYVGGGVREYEGKMIRLMHFGWATDPDFIREGVTEVARAYEEVECRNL